MRGSLSFLPWLLVLLAASCSTPSEPEGQLGILEGKVTIGPICPVEQEGVPCPVPPEAYAARKIVVRDSRGSRVIKTVSIDSQGLYQVSLSPDTYIIDINRIGIDSSKDVPKTVRIAAGQTLILSIDIDTGIR